MSQYGTSITPGTPFENDGPVEAALSGFPAAQDEVVETSPAPAPANEAPESRAAAQSSSSSTHRAHQASAHSERLSSKHDSAPPESRIADVSRLRPASNRAPTVASATPTVAYVSDRHPSVGVVSPSRRAAGSQAEVFGEAADNARTYTRYAPIGRGRRTIAPFQNDLTVGKFGVLDPVEADALERKLFSSFAHDDLLLGGRSQSLRDDFLRALHLFLAINSGSIGNVVGRMGVRDDSQPLQFGDVQLAAADVATILGDRAYSYMRARATEIRDTIEAAVTTSLLPEAETKFPGVCNAVDLVKTVAATKGLSQYPQYVAVGSQYAVGTPPYVITAINQSSAKVLAGTQGNVRHSDVPLIGDGHD